MLAYLFWHRPRAGVEAGEYEAAQRGFHARLESPSACFAVAELPFAGGAEGAAYEDWYLVDDWAALGALNAAAVDARRRPEHDRAAALAGDGWGGVYALARGEAAIPAAVRWLEKPRGQALDSFVADLGGAPAVWQRQLVLGPAPEVCVAASGPPRRRVA